MRGDKRPEREMRRGIWAGREKDNARITRAERDETKAWARRTAVVAGFSLGVVGLRVRGMRAARTIAVSRCLYVRI